MKGFVKGITSFFTLILNKNFWTKLSKLLKEHLHIVKAKLQNLSDTNFELGVYHFYSGNIDDAILRFKLVQCFSKKKYDDIEYYLGRLYLEKCNMRRSLSHLNTYLSEHYNNTAFLEEARYSARIAERNLHLIDYIPLPLIARKFDIEAVNFHQTNAKINDKKFEEDHILLKNFSDTELVQLLNDNKIILTKVLDLGCGLGYGSRFIRSISTTSNMIGVDISQRSIEFAESMKILGVISYNSLIIDDILHYIARDNIQIQEENYQLLMLLDVLMYIAPGRIDLLFRSLSKIAAEQSILIISFKNINTYTVDDNTGVDVNKWRFNDHLEEFEYSAKWIISKIITDYGWKLAIEKQDKVKFKSNNHRTNSSVFMVFTRDSRSE